MGERGATIEQQATGTAAAGWVRASGVLTMIGGALLTIGAILIDLGWYADLPAVASLGNAFAAVSGLGLIFLPLGLRGSRLGGTGMLAKVGTVSLLLGLCLASIVDVPAILDPTNLEAGGAFGPIGLLLISVGFLAWFVAIRGAGSLAGWRPYTFLAAGLWLPLTFPALQLPLFVIPNDRPCFVLLAGVLGLLQLTMGAILRGRMAKGGFTAEASNRA